MTHVTKENTTSFLGMIEHFNMLFYWLVWLIAVLADTTQQVAKHLWLLIYWFMFLNTNCPPVFIYLFFFKSFMPAHEFPLLIFLTEHNFSAAQSHMYWYIYTKWIFSTIKRRNRKLGGIGWWSVHTVHTKDQSFCISTWSFQVKILKLIKHRHNATFSVKKKKEDFEDFVMFIKKYSAYYSF